MENTFFLFNLLSLDWMWDIQRTSQKQKKIWDRTTRENVYSCFFTE